MSPEIFSTQFLFVRNFKKLKKNGQVGANLTGWLEYILS